MRLLLFDETVRQEFRRVIQYAESHRFSTDELIQRIEAGGPSIGDDPGHVCFCEHGYKIVFSVEEQNFGWCNHLSVSVDNPNKVPSIEAVRALMLEFGMQKPLEQCYVYIEDVMPKAINVICLQQQEECVGVIPC
jgi:hypothetical protein